jgi:hypothetical protein
VNSGSGVAESSRSALSAWYCRFGSRKITGSSLAIACWIIQ